jgi:large repetitive protein
MTKGSRCYCLSLVACVLTLVLTGCSWLTPDLDPVAVISATPASGRAPLVVQLSGSLSNDDVGILEYSWEFPNQDPAQMIGIQGERSFQESGDYTVRLTVTDSAGQSNATEVLIHVENTPPIASARFSNDAPIPGESVLFDASSSLDPDGQLIDFIWDFGDGSTRRGTRVSHVYSQLGLYEVRLTVVDNAGALSTISHTMTVHTQSPGGGCGG